MACPRTCVGIFRSLDQSLPAVDVSKMATAIIERSDPGISVGQRLDLDQIDWDTYVAINDALGDRGEPRLIYIDGQLTIMTRSRVHDWLAEHVGLFVPTAAAHLGLNCVPSGETTFRKRAKEAGLEGDRTYHFGANAIRMRRARNFDPNTDPVPDLAIEIEVTHSAKKAMRAWGRLGVPEVWRFDASADWSCTFWKRKADGGYRKLASSSFLPTITPAEVVAKLLEADEIGTTAFILAVGRWVEEVVRPRIERGRR